MVNAQIKMKALVVSRLMMGDIKNWEHYKQELEMARKIVNRKLARKASSQIGYKYKDLSHEVNKFISQNFIGATLEKLAMLCDNVSCSLGFSDRLDEFEKQYFGISYDVKRRYPLYAHVHISTHGLAFEFPEHHFLKDIEDALPELLETQRSLTSIREHGYNKSRDRERAGALISKEKFLSRSIISASFSLVESFVSGSFFTVASTGSIGSLSATGEFIDYARRKDNASLKDRLDRLIRFCSSDNKRIDDEPFSSFIHKMKRYRDAIHHTTPFERKDIESGGRLSLLYEIDAHIAFLCIKLLCDALLEISLRIDGSIDITEISIRCNQLLQKLQDSPDKSACRDAAH